MSNLSKNTKLLTEGTIIIALTIILKDILPPFLHLPQGGSVSLAGMVPLLWFSLRHGLSAGMEAGAIYGLVNMAFGGYVVDPIQGLLGYPIAFSVLGLAGLFKKHPLVGVCVGISARFLVHFIEGVWFFSIYAGDMHPIIYSALYNGSYLVVELIISVAIVYVLMRRRLLDIFIS